MDVMTCIQRAKCVDPMKEKMTKSTRVELKQPLALDKAHDFMTTDESPISRVDSSYQHTTQAKYVKEKRHTQISRENYQ